MDLLSQRYANPYLICDDFIRLNQFHDFVVTVILKMAEEKTQKRRWEYYIHRVFDMTFEDYVALCESKPKEQDMSNEQIVDVVNESRNILKGYIPESE